MNLPAFNIKQIYFDAKSQANCSSHPYVKTFDNSGAEIKWFENEVIARNIPHGGVYFGVWSHKAISKIRQAGNKDFSFEQLETRIENAHKPVISFHHNHKKLPIFHNEKGKYLNDMMSELMEFLGWKYRPNMRVDCGIMQNHFLMQLDTYKFYREELLKAMAFIDKHLNERASTRSPYLERSNVFYSWHTFILERFASAFVYQYDLPFHHYKDLKI